MRLAPRQDPGADASGRWSELLRAALPAGAELEIRGLSAAPALFDPDSPALTAGPARRSRAPAARRRSSCARGGSIPIVAEMASRGYPVIVGGFGLPADAIHAPNESYALRSLELGEAAARELLRALSGL